MNSEQRAGGPDESTDVRLTDEQRRVMQEHARVALVVGAPGTGKTTLAVETVAARVASGRITPDQVTLIAPTRTGAARLRQRMVARLAGTTTAPPARTASSIAFSVLHRVAAADPDGQQPRLLSGAEQDLILADLLAGHRAAGTGPVWPKFLRQALTTRGFRDQLRDLLMRAAEHGLDPAGLADLGARAGRAEWVAAAQVFAEYDEVTALASPGAYDPAWIATAAAAAIAEDPVLADRVHRELRLLIVDDAQELTASAAELIVALAGPATDVILIGDPDATVQGFRGAEPGRMVQVAERIAAADRSTGQPQRHQLTISHRHGEQLATVVGRVADRIGVSAGVGARHRNPRPAGDGALGSGHPGQVRALTAHSHHQQLALVADGLRRAHLLEGVPWSQMAVIARTRSAHEGLRRAMSRVGVPVHLPGGGLRLADQPAVRTLLLAYEVCLRPTAAPSAVEVVELLTSPLGGVDPGMLRRLRHLAGAAAAPARARRAAADAQADSAESAAATSADSADAESAGGAADPTTEADRVLAELVSVVPGVDPKAAGDLAAGRLGWSDPAGAARTGVAAVRSVARVLAAGAAAADQEPGHVLWALWSASGLAGPMEQAALRAGPGGDRASRDLDALVTLFGAAERFTERVGRMPASAFLDHVRAQEIASDSLVDRASPDQAVQILTPQTAAGRQWRRVFVVGVQDGVWPDLRIRDTLLGAQALADRLGGRGDEEQRSTDPNRDGAAAQRSRQSVRTDELRQFHVAISRASEQVTVLAVDSADERPSSFVDLLGVPVQNDPIPPDRLTLRGVIADLRRDLVLAERAGDTPGRERAIAGLVKAGRATAPVGAVDPDRWWGANQVSDARALRAQDQVVLSPSHLQSFTECPLRWLLSGRGGQDPEHGTAAAVGTLIHDLVADHPDADAAALLEDLDRRWPELGLGAGWIVDRYRQQARSMLERYARYTRSVQQEGFTRVEVERAYDVQIGPARVTARVDRVEYREDGSARVVDLKTGATQVTAAQAEQNPQLGVYQLVVDPDRPAPAGAALVYLAAGARGPLVRRQAPVGTAADPGWVHTLIEAAAEGMTSSQFPAQPGPWCQNCQIRSSCPAQPEGEVIGL